MSKQYTFLECTPVGTYGLQCPPGWESEGYTPAGSCYNPYTYGPGWRRVCARYTYDPNRYPRSFRSHFIPHESGDEIGGVGGFEAPSISECCVNWNTLSKAERQNCKERGLRPYGMKCNDLMQQSCSQSGSTDCDKYISGAPRGSWYYNQRDYDLDYPEQWFTYGSTPLYTLPRDADPYFIYRDPPQGVPRRYRNRDAISIRPEAYQRIRGWNADPGSAWQPIVNIPRITYA